MSKTHWKKFHNPDYLGAYAFEPNERKVLTIASAKQETVIGASARKEECLVVHFQENEKPLIANVTNSKAISKVAGSSYIEDWTGVKIELFITQVSAFGETVDAVRVKQTPPVLTKPVLSDIDKAAQAVINGTTRELIEKHYTVTEEAWAQVQIKVDQLKSAQAD